LRGYKGQFYEGGIRVPFIARWPGHIKPGSTSDHICGFWDVMPTLAEIAGAPAPDKTDGISIVPTLTAQGEQKQHQAIYWEYPVRRGNEISRAARMGRWKAVQNRPQGPIELFDLQTDIGEAKDLAQSHPEVLQQIVAIMDAAHVPPRAYPKATVQPTVDDYVR
jgi:arylsulfatase A-like enzyme